VAKHIVVHKATRIGRQVDPAEVRITEPFPASRYDSDKWRDELSSTYRGDATAIADVLIETLPGGTVDALMAELLQRRASLLMTPMPSVDHGKRGTDDHGLYERRLGFRVYCLALWYMVMLGTNWAQSKRDAARDTVWWHGRRKGN
jgi:hypothetical protein